MDPTMRHVLVPMGPMHVRNPTYRETATYRAMPSYLHGSSLLLLKASTNQSSALTFPHFTDIQAVLMKSLRVGCEMHNCIK